MTLREDPDATRRRWCIGPAVITTVVIGLVTAACGGASSPGVANLGATTTVAPAPTAGSSGDIGATQIRYARCMQTHGVPDYPEPAGNGTVNVGALRKLGLGSPAVLKASRECQSVLPKSPPAAPGALARVLAQALKFAQCMQTHGMPSWPDPSSRGYMVAPAGAAAQSPTYLRAAKICRPLLPS